MYWHFLLQKKANLYKQTSREANFGNSSRESYVGFFRTARGYIDQLQKNAWMTHILYIPIKRENPKNSTNDFFITIKSNQLQRHIRIKFINKKKKTFLSHN